MSPQEVVLAVHSGRPDAVEMATAAAAALGQHGIGAEVVVLGRSTTEEGRDRLDELEPGLIVSLGGDGTFLRTAQRAHQLDIPVLGVNFGRVGYLLNMAPAELHGTIIDTLEGRVTVEARAGLELDAGPTGRWFVVNEVSLEKTVPGHVVRIATEIDAEPFLTYAADGVLVSTPTGSTAYNLSAGGPVLAPQIDGFVMTPVAPHLVIDRSVVLGGEQRVQLEVVGDRNAVCVVDGRPIGEFTPGEQLMVRRHERRLKVVVLAELGLGQRLRESLRQVHE